MSLNTVEQFRPDYVFLAPDKYLLDYTTIVAPVDAQVWFDCKETDPQLIQTTCDPIPELDWTWLQGAEYKTVQFQVTDGVHKVWSNQPISVIAYGYDERVSYGYPAGLNIYDLKLIDEP